MERRSVCVIPEKWYLEPIKSREDAQLVVDWLNKNKEDWNTTEYTFDGGIEFWYMHFPSYNRMYHYSCSPHGDYTKITVEQFKKYILKQDNTMKDFITSRQQLQYIYNVACSTWQPKIKDMAIKYGNPFNNIVTLPYDIVKLMFEAATKEQLPTLKKVFPEYSKDNNAFIDIFSWESIKDTSKKLFGDTEALQIATSAVKDTYPELKGRALYISANYNVEIVSGIKSDGTVIKITKK